MWQFPNGALLPGETVREGLRRVLREVVGLEAEIGAEAGVVKHGVTRYRVTLTARHCPRFHGVPEARGCAEWRWAPVSALEEFAFPSAHRRLAEIVRREGAHRAGGVPPLEESQLGLALAD
jgi:ADP-ribose pyrophosphatase YjhB (NUDIX family)